MKRTVIAAGMFFFTLMLFSCKDPGTSPVYCKDYTGKEMKGLLNVRLAKEIADAYRTGKTAGRITANGEDDTRSVWFDLETIKQYIWKIEDTLRKQQCDPEKLQLGLRVYFGVYPDSSRMKEFGVDPSYAHHQTVFLVATYKGEKNEVDFDPFNIGPDKCKPTSLKLLLARIGTGAAGNAGTNIYKTGWDSEGGVLNHGGLRPPPSGDSGIFPED